MADYIPSYIEEHRTGRLRQQAAGARSLLSCCNLCPRQCGVDRTAGETGVCNTGVMARVSSYGPHFGEETPLVGSHGSGTIFFSFCNLRCNFCQNYDISHLGDGHEVDDETLARIMLALQDQGCHNINLVTPSHVVPQILAAVDIAAGKGLSVPIVFNTSAYDRVPTLKMLDGVVDIYMPDFKFWDPKVAQMTCDAPDYPEIARSALIEMHRQVGDLVIDSAGLATRGLLIRHLVLPDNLAGTREVMRFIAGRVSVDSYVNVMPQYRPCGTAATIESLARRPTTKEFEAAMAMAREEGLTRLDPRRRVFVLR